MDIANDITSLVGNTPLVKLNRIRKFFNCYPEIIAKLESFNPSASVKDRIAYSMLCKAEEEGLITPDKTTLIEATSGNTGIALAMVAAAKGYKLILTMPDTMSIERRAMLRAYGAELQLTPGKEGMKGALDLANELSSSIANSYQFNQFENFANPDIHERTTAQEIWAQSNNNLDGLVTGVGTGGTITGCARFLKKVVTASDGKEALKLFKDYEPDLVVLDVMMPKLDGYGVCQELRKDSDVPIVMLTALGDVADRITGLELGADDYVVKPFSPKELEARIRCVLRRIDKEQIPGMPNSGLILVTDIKIDTNRRQVFKSDERIRLTGMEFSLLELLVSRSGEPFSRGEILKEVWGYTPERHVDTRVVDVHISRLRSKLEADPANPELILTARGTGYLFQRIVDIAPFDGK